MEESRKTVSASATPTTKGAMMVADNQNGNNFLGVPGGKNNNKKLTIIGE